MMIRESCPSKKRQCVLQRLFLQPLACQQARTAQSVKDAEGTAQLLVLDALRWACYLPTESMDVADSKILQELDSVCSGRSCCEAAGYLIK